jgi:hypothetical protein
MKCYLAHPVTDYARSVRQLLAIAAIRARGWTVENPDTPEHTEAYKNLGMAHFAFVVQDCQALAFLRFPNKKIGAGVGKEIAVALRIGIPVYDAETMERYFAMPAGIMTVEETRTEIASLRASAPIITATQSIGTESAA